MPGHTETDVPRASLLYRVAARLAFHVMRLQRWRVEVRGLDHIPRHGGAVIVANHTSFWDFFVSGGGAYFGLGRPVRILAKASLFDTPVFGRIMRDTGQIPVHRAAGSRALTSAVEALRRGELVLVLPEQTISPSFELLTFKRGAARMAAAAGVPLVPAVSWGTHRFHTVGRRPRPRWRLPVTVRYGAPVWPEPGSDPYEVMAQLRDRMTVLLDQEQRAYPEGTPAGRWWVPARLGGTAPRPEEAAAELARLEAGWRAAAAARFAQARQHVLDEAEEARRRLEAGRERVQEQAEHARGLVQAQTEHAREVVHEQAEQTRERVQEQAEHARERVREGAEQARGRVQLQTEQARHRWRGVGPGGDRTAGRPEQPGGPDHRDAPGGDERVRCDDAHLAGDRADAPPDEA